MVYGSQASTRVWLSPSNPCLSRVWQASNVFRYLPMWDWSSPILSWVRVTSKFRAISQPNVSLQRDRFINVFGGFRERKLSHPIWKRGLGKQPTRPICMSLMWRISYNSFVLYFVLTFNYSSCQWEGITNLIVFLPAESGSSKNFVTLSSFYSLPFLYFCILNKSTFMHACTS